MTQYAGNASNFPTDYTIVSDNTDRTASSVNVALTALGDRTAWLKAHAIDGLLGGTYTPSGPLNISNLGTLSGSGPLTLTGNISCNQLQANSIATALFTMPDGGIGIGHEFSTTFFRVNTDLTFKQTGSAIVSASTRSKTLVLQAPFYANPTHWAVLSGSTMSQLTIDTGVGRRLFANLDTGQYDCTITLARLWVKAATGHGVLPAVTDRLRFALYKQPKLGGSTVTVFADTGDPSGTVGNYEQYHSIPLSGAEVYTPATHRYYFEITGEKGANFVAGAEVYMIEIIFTYTIVAR